jgi:hypothetical protein
MSRFAAVVLFAGVTLYAIFGGADFGAGFWDLTAGGAERGRRPRGLIDRSIGPVWEANHVWLIFCLVVLWTAFPTAFAAIMTTVYIPLGLAALGIVLRGSGFAFRKVSVRTPTQRANGAVFATSSVVTPFFMGVVAGAIASGRILVAVATPWAAGSTRRRCSEGPSLWLPAPTWLPCFSPPRPDPAGPLTWRCTSAAEPRWPPWWRASRSWSGSLSCTPTLVGSSIVSSVPAYHW